MASFLRVTVTLLAMCLSKTCIENRDRDERDERMRYAVHYIFFELVGTNLWVQNKGWYIFYGLSIFHSSFLTVSLDFCSDYLFGLVKPVISNTD